MSIPQNNSMSKADQLFHKGYAAHHAGNLEEAERCYRKAVLLAPRDVETVYFLGTVCSQLGKLEDAVKYLEQVLNLDPRHIHALNSLGLTVMGKNLTEGIRYFRRAVEIDPNYPDALSNLGKALELAKEYDEAEAVLRHAIQVNPNLANAHFCLGLVLSAKDRFEEAARHFVRGLQLQPDYPPAYSDLGGIYKTWGRLEQALECFDRGVQILPGAYYMHSNRGTILEELGRYEEALEEYQIAAKLNPNDPTPRWNSAYLYLKQGILDKGWDLHEMRLEAGGQVSIRFPFPQWDGSSLEGKTILIYAEQGLGDEIFYASCIRDAIAQAKHCIIECDKRLAPLFARSFPTATVVGGDRLEIGWLLNMPHIDVQSAVGSLPRFFRRKIESFPKKPDYLHADPARVEYWRSRLSLSGASLKVGICWRSGLLKGARHKFYSSLTQWREIFDTVGVQFVNLQYDECKEELQEAEEMFGISISVFPEVDLRNDLDETAALISAMDVVISAGTAISEIAGALGVETLRLDPFGRQMESLGTDQLPWHPATRLFRQLAVGDWETPIAMIGVALKEKAQGQEQVVSYVRSAYGVDLAVSGSLNDPATYIMSEQGKWYDPEYDFVMGLARPGMQVLDVGAGAGVYAVPLAAKIENGKLWAFTDSAADVKHLMRSRAYNKLENCLNISAAGVDLSLDAEMDKHGLINIDFIRLANHAFHSRLLGASPRFLAANSPLIMFGVQPGEAFNAAMVEQLKMFGYEIYRLIPGLGLLAPFVLREELDAYALNLFACKPDRAEQLERQGLLIKQMQQPQNIPGAAQKYWQEYLAELPYAVARLQQWLASPQQSSDREMYWIALNLFALAKSAQTSPVERYGCLQTAAGTMAHLVQQHATIPRLLSFCRILLELGKREAVVNVLNQTCGLMHKGMTVNADEPFLTLTEADQQVDPGEKAADWMAAKILERREGLRAFSTFFTKEESLQVYEEIRGLGFAGGDVEKRLELIRARSAA